MRRFKAAETLDPKFAIGIFNMHLFVEWTRLYREQALQLEDRSMKRAAIYARVSTRNGHQDPETQLLALREVAERAGWQIAGEYVDHGISGAKGRDKRPEFDRLLKDATRRQFDVVMAWSVDRLGRSLQDLVAFLGDLHAQGVDLYLHIQGIDTTTPGGKALFQMMGVFAEFERAIIQERVCAGLAKARAKGKRLGRPKVPLSVERSIQAARAAGKGQLAIARELRVGVGTVRRVLGAASSTG
jgi:DNA invertase Pin-like site-specific DNA recombinase